MRSSIWFGMCLWCLVAMMGSVMACDAPIAFMTKKTNDLTQQLGALSVKKENARKEKALLHRLQLEVIRKTVLPIVDAKKISQSVVGARYWRAASSEEQSRFEKAFTELVLGFYLAAFSGDIQDYTIRYQPLRGKPNPLKVVATSIIKSSTMRPVTVKYYLLCHDSEWRITDFDVNAISMVSSYRAQFASTLSSKGFAGLIEAIERHNKQNDLG